MNKGFLVIFVIFVGIALAGCSNNNQATQTSSTSSSATGELSDVDPWLKSKKFVREQITDPVLYSYLSSSGLGNIDTSIRSNLTSEEQKKIGKVSAFSKSTKYNISGTAEIVATDTIAVKNFTYNGACGTISFQLAASNALDRSIATLKSINTAVSAQDGNFNLTIPSNITLIQFNTVKITCQNIESPVSQATYN